MDPETIVRFAGGIGGLLLCAVVFFAFGTPVALVYLADKLGPALWAIANK